MSKRVFGHIASAALFFVVACGVGVGNPTKQILITDQDFQKLLDYYSDYKTNQSSPVIDCGSYTEKNPETEVDQGRQCIRDAFFACNPAKYLLDKRDAASMRFVSFVWVEKSADGKCEIGVHTASTYASIFFGTYASSCESIHTDEVIEFACSNGAPGVYEKETPTNEKSPPVDPRPEHFK